VLDYKDQMMLGETPRCRRERLTIDLNDALQRRAIYEAAGSTTALMITEGLLLYLPAATVEALASESPNQSGIRHWIGDVTTSAFSRALAGGTESRQPIRHVQASDALEGEQILDVIRRYGWTTASKRSYITDAEFVQERVLRVTGAPPPQFPFPPGDPTGVHRFDFGG
jgi:O-methyltransferase involved in polyketide biosynthesis